MSLNEPPVHDPGVLLGEYILKFIQYHPKSTVDLSYKLIDRTGITFTKTIRRE